MESELIRITVTSSLVDNINTSELLGPLLKREEISQCPFEVVQVKEEHKNLPLTASIEKVVTSNSRIKEEPYWDQIIAKQYPIETSVYEQDEKQEPLYGKPVEKDKKCGSLECSYPETNLDGFEDSSYTQKVISVKTKATEIVDEIPKAAVDEWKIKNEEIDLKEEDVEEAPQRNLISMLPNYVAQEKNSAPEAFKYQNRHQGIERPNIRIQPNQQTIRDDILKAPLLEQRNRGDLPIIKCDQCDFQSEWGRSFRSHLRLHHKKPDEVLMFECGECQFKSKSKYRLKDHLRMHQNPDELVTFKCSQCEYKAHRKANIMRHLLKHKDPSEVTTFKCNQCSYQSLDKHLLAKHLLVHQNPEDVTMFKCQQCSFQTKRNLALKKHARRVHNNSEEDMFQCDVCEHRCKSKHGLMEHLLLHRKPEELVMFKCGQCQYQTFRKRNLKRHIITQKHE